MIKIVISRDRSGSVKSLNIDGHAGFAAKGNDIVCAAVSVTAYTAAGALEDLVGLNGHYSDRDGHMTIKLPQEMTQKQRETAAVILETTVIGFRQIGQEYGKYVKVVDEEV